MPAMNVAAAIAGLTPASEHEIRTGLIFKT